MFGQRALVAHLKAWWRRWKKRGREADAAVAADLGRACCRGGHIPADSAAAVWLDSRGWDHTWLSAAQAAEWLA
eukprot:9232847-Alexandrium_andersonii.AAC.1